MKTEKPTAALRRGYKRLAERLARIGWVLQGTITERLDTRESPKGSGTITTCGPYYQWTFKRQGKTVTVNLTASQARAYQKAIDNQRKIEEILREMRELSLQFLEATTESVKRRNPRQ